MADSGATRAKRARRHKAGDHRLCRPETCTEATEAPSRVVTSRVTPGGRGGRLWAQMNEGRGLAPTHVVLLEEACRMADRLDRYDAMLSGEHKEWFRLEVPEDGSEVVLIVDRLQSEARMLASAYKSIVAELRQALEDAGAARPPGPTPQAPTGGGGGNVVGLHSRVAAKRAQTTG